MRYFLNDVPLDTSQRVRLDKVLAAFMAPFSVHVSKEGDIT